MSTHDMERGLIARYVVRVLERNDLPMRSIRYILYWLNERAELLNLPLPKTLTKSIGNIYSGGTNLSEFSKVYEAHREQLVAQMRDVADQSGRPEPIATNLERLVDALGLPNAAWKIVGLVACYSRFELVQYFCSSVVEATGLVNKAIAVLVGESARDVETLIVPSGDLVASGLLQYRDGFSDLGGPAGRFCIPSRLDQCLDQDFKGFTELRAALLGAPLTANIEARDYDHVAEDVSLLRAVLKGAVKEKAKGVNVLLYGPPGSGKTELTKVIAQSTGLSLYAAGEELAATGETDRSARLSDLVFALKLLSGAKKTVMLFDEMEDVAWQMIKRGGSKLYLNRVLESNPVPVLWTSNNINEIDPAILRRMTLAIELKKPPARQRERILRRLSKRVGVKLSNQEVNKLAHNLDTTPAVLENALKAARFAGGGAPLVEQAAKGIVRAISGITAREKGDLPEFDPVLCCASRNLLHLSDRLEQNASHHFSLCLSGPPGTGKSAFARYLAKQLGLDVLHKRASDLLGPYVGQSEKQIAEAFEEARASKSFLIFDEADSLLFDRTQAHRSWEITQVNEMLTWMEEHPLPVCFTTNLMDRLDTASLRRFTFHIRFDYMDRPALKRAWQLFFGLNRISGEALRFENLTPGDFAQVRKQAEVLGLLEDQSALVDLLGEVSRAKPGAKGGMGFVG